jgi:hypothetical protein
MSVLLQHLQQLWPHQTSSPLTDPSIPYWWED